ncbi:peroxiredoxin [Altererythrobacter sp. CAU 1778]
MSEVQVGDTIPDIAMETPDGGTVRPSDFAGAPVVLFFYPKDNTPGCTTEALDFTALKPEFDKAGVKLLGISKDSPQKHRNFIAKHDLATPLATDAETGGLSDALGIWTEKTNYGRTYMGIVRTTLLLDAEGKVAQVWNRVRVKDHAHDVLQHAQSL